MANWFKIVLWTVLIVVTILVIALGLFDVWVFAGVIVLLFMYLGGYFYIITFYKAMQEKSNFENNKRSKFDYCWSRVNSILSNMAGGQGLEWAKGFGRQSVIKNYHNGIQFKPYRAMIGHLSDSQQLAVVIYDIDGDDIAAFYANPSAEVITNPFSSFKPFQKTSQYGMGAGYVPRRTSKYSRYPSGRGVSVNIGDDYSDFGSIPQSPMPDDNVTEQAFEKLKDK